MSGLPRPRRRKWAQRGDWPCLRPGLRGRNVGCGRRVCTALGLPKGQVDHAWGEVLTAGLGPAERGAVCGFSVDTGCLCAAGQTGGHALGEEPERTGTLIRWLWAPTGMRQCRGHWEVPLGSVCREQDGGVGSHSIK